MKIEIVRGKSDIARSFTSNKKAKSRFDGTNRQLRQTVNEANRQFSEAKAKFAA
jgi:hypothetical protein